MFLMKCVGCEYQHDYEICAIEERKDDCKCCGTCKYAIDYNHGITDRCINVCVGYSEWKGL